MNYTDSNDINKAYVSPYDIFWYTFDANHPKSPSQEAEIKKYQRIFALRDTASEMDPTIL